MDQEPQIRLLRKEPPSTASVPVLNSTEKANVHNGSARTPVQPIELELHVLEDGRTVDEFLYTTASNPRERMALLKLDQELEDFLLDTQ